MLLTADRCELKATKEKIHLPGTRIGILTGGGDVPGLNSVIKTVTYRSTEIGCEVVGLRRGWEALTHVDLDDPASRARYVQPLNRDNTRAIDRTGGTYLHSSRSNPSKAFAIIHCPAPMTANVLASLSVRHLA